MNRTIISSAITANARTVLLFHQSSFVRRGKTNLFLSSKLFFIFDFASILRIRSSHYPMHRVCEFRDKQVSIKEILFYIFYTTIRCSRINGDSGLFIHACYRRKNKIGFRFKRSDGGVI